MPKIKDTRMFQYDEPAKPRRYRDQIDEHEDRGKRNSAKRKSLAAVESEEYFDREPEDDMLPAVTNNKKPSRGERANEHKETSLSKRVKAAKTSKADKRANVTEKSKTDERAKKAKEPNVNKRVKHFEESEEPKRVNKSKKTIENKRVMQREQPIPNQRATSATQTKKPTSSKVHAKFGSPSTLSRTQACPSWIAFGKDIPEPEESEHALEGTEFHEYMEQCAPAYLDGNDKRVALLLKECTEYEGMEEYVWDSLKKLKNLWERFREKHSGCKCHFELSVKLNEDCFGTSDVVFVGKNVKTQKMSILTIDWKYGLGVYVKAQENLQGIAYLLATARTLDIPFEDIGIGMIIIAQVRLNDDWEQENFIVKGPDFAVREEAILGIVANAKRIYNGGLPIESNLHAGDHCRFCKCQAVCPTRKAATVDALTSTATELLVSEDLPLEDQVKRLTLQEQINIFLKKSHIEDFLKAVASNLHNAFESGVSAPELKLIRTNGRRKWSDQQEPEDIARELEELGVVDPWQKKLKGLTEIEREIGKNKIDNLVEQGEGKIELVLASDKRQAIQIAQAEELPA